MCVSFYAILNAQAQQEFSFQESWCYSRTLRWSACFLSLSSLCHDLNAGLPQENPNQVCAQPSPDNAAFQQLCCAIVQGYDQRKPIVVVQQQEKWYVAEGQQRMEAACQAGLVEIPVVVVQQSISRDLNVE